jgi:hypothetical protein
MTEILGYPPTAKIHQEVAEFLKELQIKKKGILLLPRKHLKTTLITICWTIQQIINNPDIRIYLTNEKLENSKAFLREIKQHFEKNEKFRFLYGDLVNTETKWTETEIIVKTRTKNLKEPTIACGSLTSSPVAKHFDLIIADDLVSRENVSTKEQIEKVKQYWKDLLSVLEEGGIILDVGTRWHYDDLHGWLLEQAKSGNWAVMVRGCFDENGESIFPEKFSKQSLEEIKSQIGNYDFSCLYLNSPADNETAIFKRSWFENRYTDEDLKFKRVNTFCTIDIGGSSGDPHGIIVNSVDSQNNWYLRLVLRLWSDLPTLINKIFEIKNEFQVLKFGIEQKQFEDMIKPYLEEEMRRRNEFLTIEKLMDKGLRKEERIRGRLEPRFANGTIFLKQNAFDNTEDLVDELCRFPVGQYDDLADALQYQQDIVSPPFLSASRGLGGEINKTFK